MGKALLRIGGAGLGAVFIYAAYTKIRAPFLLFAMAIDAYKLLPEWAAVALARGLPWFELFLGIALVSGLLLRYTALMASALLAVFFGVMVRSYMLGQQINCGCFGIGEALSPKTLVRDAALLGLSLAVTLGAFLVARSGPGAAADPAAARHAAETQPEGERAR
jgi:putative oxidoreductase